MIQKLLDRRYLEPQESQFRVPFRRSLRKILGRFGWSFILWRNSNLHLHFLLFLFTGWWHYIHSFFIGPWWCDICQYFFTSHQMCRSRSAFLHRCGRGNSTWKRVHLVSRPLETSFYGTLALGETGKQSEFCSFSWSCETSHCFIASFFQAEWSATISVTIKKKHLPHPYENKIGPLKKTSNKHPHPKKKWDFGEKKQLLPLQLPQKKSKKQPRRVGIQNFQLRVTTWDQAWIRRFRAQAT